MRAVNRIIYLCQLGRSYFASRFPGFVHSTPEQFKNGGFTIRKHQTVSIHSTLEESKNGTIAAYFGFVFEEYSGKEIAGVFRYFDSSG